MSSVDFRILCSKSFKMQSHLCVCVWLRVITGAQARGSASELGPCPPLQLADEASSCVPEGGSKESGDAPALPFGGREIRG